MTGFAAVTVTMGENPARLRVARGVAAGFAAACMLLAVACAMLVLRAQAWPTSSPFMDEAAGQSAP